MLTVSVDCVLCYLPRRTWDEPFEGWLSECSPRMRGHRGLQSLAPPLDILNFDGCLRAAMLVSLYASATWSTCRAGTPPASGGLAAHFG